MADEQRAQVARQSLDSLRAAEDAVEQSVAAEGRTHVDKLAAVLALARQYAAEGRSLSAPSAIALQLRSSEWKADRLLSEASLLTALPEALDAIACGVLTVEQSSVVVVELGKLTDLATRLSVWRRLLERLRQPGATVLPPTRLRERLQRWVAEADPQDASERRQAAEDERRVEYRKRDDGLADILLFGVAAPLAQSVLQRIQKQSQPVGLFDDRTADQLRADAMVDLLLGRAGRSCPAGDGPGCDCRPGELAPCGVDTRVLVPVGGALGTTDETAHLVGHGPIDSDQLAAVLANSPRLRAVFVDDQGVPVAVGRRATPSTT